VAELYQQHGRMVLGLCRLLLRDAAEAEDAAQQTFLSAYRSLLGGTEPRQPAAWLATIARNECWARTRDRMREPLAEPDPEGPSDAPDPLDATIRRADLDALWSAIDDLPPQQRDALLMREFSGLSYEELAETLDVTQPAVESLLFRARRELRVRLRPALAPALIIPVGVLREALIRLLGDSAAIGAAAKVAAVPAAAKVAAGTAAVGLVAGGVVAVDPQLITSLRQQPTSSLVVQAPVRRPASKPVKQKPASKPKEPASKPKRAAPARSALPAKAQPVARKPTVTVRPSAPARVVVRSAPQPRRATVPLHRSRFTVPPEQRVQWVHHVQPVQHLQPVRHVQPVQRVQPVRREASASPAPRPARSHVRQARVVAPVVAPKVAQTQKIRVRARPAAPKVKPRARVKPRPALKPAPAPAAPAPVSSPADVGPPSKPRSVLPTGRAPGLPARLPPDRRFPQPVPPSEPPATQPPAIQPPATQPPATPGTDGGSPHAPQPSPGVGQPSSTPPPPGENPGPAPGAGAGGSGAGSGDPSGSGPVNIGSGPINAAPLLAGAGRGTPVQGGSPSPPDVPPALPGPVSR
jgi:RNA polymerase sigma-70 factor (ECF subfamily)